MGAKPLIRPEKVELLPSSVDPQVSPPVLEEEVEEEQPEPFVPDGKEEEASEVVENKSSFSVPAARSQPLPSGRNGFSASPEERSRQAQVIKTLETKVRTLQKQRQEDHTQLQNVQDVQAKATRYEGIIQTLQKKLKTNQQDMQELKSRYEDAETRAAQVPDRSGEQDSALELATLDKEMAEERAEIFESELEALKLKHEELELESEILREENRELVSVMSPEEKASAGWLQMERETERLRQALILLRDVSQQNEADLRNEIKEFQESVDELEQAANKYEETAAKLHKSEETSHHLREQLEAAEANDEILESLSAERDHSRNMIENLKRQIQDLEEHIQVADELESFHVEEEKRLHYQLDESEAFLHDKHRQGGEQEKIIEDLEYTFTKFRDVVQGLQSDIDELRRTREISELEANEMSSKSRAMMDLNLKLQNSAAKTQMKAIDVELGKMRAQQANLHLEIVQLFIPEAFEPDRKPILALLCFKRIRSKAQLCRTILTERLRDRADLHENPMAIFAIVERIHFIANLCDRFVEFMSTCSTDSFMKYAGAPFELDPVEQAMNSWVEALRRDEIAHEGSEHLYRMADILVDMSEKLLTESLENKAMQLIASISMVENYSDNVASETQVLSRAVQARLGSAKDDNEDSLLFERKLDQIGIKARTVKYMSGKVTTALMDLRDRSMCLGESLWTILADAESCAEALSQSMRNMGEMVLNELNKIETEEPPSYSKLVQLLMSSASGTTQTDDSRTVPSPDVFEALLEQLQILQSRIDDLNTKSADLSSAVEFEKQSAPWIVRAREVKAQKAMSHDLQEEVGRLKLKIQEQMMRIGEKDKELEEQQVKVELLESRAKETKVKDDGVKEMKDEISKLRSENMAATENLQQLKAEYQTLLESRESQKLELEAVKQKGAPDGQGLPLGRADESATLRLKAEADQLRMELISLQAAVRFLKAENRQLRIPVGDLVRSAVQHSWLDPGHLQAASRDDRTQQLRAESKDAFTQLIQMAKTARPVRVTASSVNKHEENEQTTTWRSRSETTLYKVLQQKEELERWNEVKNDLVKKARIMAWSARGSKQPPGEERVLSARPVRTSGKQLQDFDFEFVSSVDGVRIL